MTVERWVVLSWKGVVALSALVLVAGCGEPMYENAGSQLSLQEDREACTVEMEQTPAAVAYRQNPSAHPDYVSQVFEDINRCIERKGWKQVRSPQEQEQMRDAIASEVTRTELPLSTADLKASDTIVRSIEGKLPRSSRSQD